MKKTWSTEELIEHWSLSEHEWTELLERKQSLNRWALGVALKYCRLTGRFPHSSREIPEIASLFVAEQIGLGPAKLNSFNWAQ